MSDESFIDKVTAFMAPKEEPQEKAFEESLYRFLMPTPEQRVTQPSDSRVDREVDRARGYSHTDAETPDQIFERIYKPEIGWMQQFAKDSPDGDVKAAYKKDFLWGDNWTDRHQKRYDRLQSVWSAAHKIVNAGSGGGEGEEYQVAAEASKGVDEKDYQDLIHAVYQLAGEKSKGRGAQSWFNSLGKSVYRGMASIIPNIEATFLALNEVEGGTAAEGPLKGAELVGAKQAGDPAIDPDAPWYKRWPVEAAGMAPTMGAGILGAIGVAAVSGPAGAYTAPATATAFWATQIFPQEYRSLVGEGVDEKTAKTAAIISAVLQGAVENLEFNPFKGGSKAFKTIRASALDSAKRYGKEVSEEGLQSLISTATEAVTTDMDDPAGRAFENAVEAILESAGPISVLMAPGAAIGARRARRLGKKEEADTETMRGLDEKLRAFHAEQSSQEGGKEEDQGFTKVGRDEVNVALWVANNPELRPVFESVAAKKAPSRSDLKKLLGPDVWLTANERVELADQIRDALEAGPAIEEQADEVLDKAPPAEARDIAEEDVDYIKSAIPGAKVAVSEDRRTARVSLPVRGRGTRPVSFTYESTGHLPLDLKQVAATHGEAFAARVAEDPSAFAAGRFTLANGVGKRVIDGFGLMQIVEGIEGQGATVGHESLHIAKALNLFTDREWGRLEKTYAAGLEAGAVEEAIASAYEAYLNGDKTKTDGAFAKIKAFVQRIIKAASGLSGERVLDAMGKERFWSRSPEVPRGGEQAVAMMPGEVGVRVDEAEAVPAGDVFVSPVKPKKGTKAARAEKVAEKAEKKAAREKAKADKEAEPEPDIEPKVEGDEVAPFAIHFGYKPKQKGDAKPKPKTKPKSKPETKPKPKPKPKPEAVLPAAERATRKRSNFAVDPKQRKWVEGVHEEYGTPDTRKREVVEKQADAELAADYEGVKKKIEKLVYDGRPLTEKESVQTRRIILKEQRNAALSGDVVANRKMVDLVMAYAATRTEGARELSLRDPLIPIEQEREIELIKAWYLPPHKVAKKQKKVKEEISKRKKSRAAVARRAFNDSLDNLAKYVTGKTFAVPIADPKLVALSVDLAAKAIKAGTLTFGEFFASVAAKIGEEVANKIAVQLEDAWMDEAERKAEKPWDEEDLKKKRAMRDEWAKSVTIMQDKLRGLGIDVSKVHEYAMDDLYYQRVQGVIDTVKASFGDKVFEYWSNAILSAPTTHGINVLSNTANAFIHMTAKRLADALVSTVIHRKEGAQWGEFKYLVKGILPGIIEGMANSIKAWQRERPFLETTLGLTALGIKVDVSRVAIVGKKGKVVRSMGYRPLVFADEFAKTIIFNMEVGARAYRRGKAAGKMGNELAEFVERSIADRSSASARIAMETAIDLTFQSRESRIAKAGLDLRRRIWGMEYVIPFVTTPTNIMLTGLRQSPLGSLPLFWRLWSGHYKGDKTAKMTEHMAEQLLAWGAVAALWMFMDDEDDVPRITGSQESYFYNARVQARQTAPAFSIRIGGADENGEYTWISYSRLEPFATTTGLILDGIRAAKSGSAEKLLELPTKSILSQITNKSYLEGLSDVLKVMDVNSGDTTARLAKWASGFVSSIVPNIIRSGLRATDRSYRERGVFGDTKDYYKRLGWRALERIEVPGSRGEQKIDRWGDVSGKSDVLGPTTGMIYEFMSPFRLASTTITKGDRTIWKWNEQNPDDEKFVVDASKKYKWDGEDVYMTDVQLKQYRILAGKTAKKLVDLEAVRVDNPTEADVKLLRDNMADARSLARRLLAEEWHGGEKVTASPAALAKQIHHKRIVSRSLPLARSLLDGRSARAELLAKQKDAAAWLKDRNVTQDEILSAWNAKRKAKWRAAVRFDPSGDGRAWLRNSLRRMKVGR